MGALWVYGWTCECPPRAGINARATKRRRINPATKMFSRPIYRACWRSPAINRRGRTELFRAQHLPRQSPSVLPIGEEALAIDNHRMNPSRLLDEAPFASG